MSSDDLLPYLIRYLVWFVMGLNVYKITMNTSLLHYIQTKQTAFYFASMWDLSGSYEDFEM